MRRHWVGEMQVEPRPRLVVRTVGVGPVLPAFRWVNMLPNQQSAGGTGPTDND